MGHETPNEYDPTGMRFGFEMRAATSIWFDFAHKKLDEAVLAAYGWKSDFSDEEILEKLLRLNLERSKKE